MGVPDTLAEIRMVQLPAALPPDVGMAVRRLVHAMAAGAGENLATVALYGGVVKGRFDPTTSDVNLLVVLRSDALPVLDVVARAVRSETKVVRVEPFVVTETEFLRSADAFPIRWLDIQRHHIVLHGQPLPEVKVERELIRIRCEQSAKNHVLRLRQAYVEKRDDRRGLWAAVTGSLSKLSVTLSAVLELCGQPVPTPRSEIFAAAAAAFTIDGALLSRLDAIAAEHRVPPDPDFSVLVSQYMALLGAVSELIDRLD